LNRLRGLSLQGSEREMLEETSALTSEDIALMEEFLDTDPFDEAIEFEIRLESGEVLDCTFMPDWEE